MGVTDVRGLTTTIFSMKTNSAARNGRQLLVGEAATDGPKNDRRHPGCEMMISNETLIRSWRNVSRPEAPVERGEALERTKTMIFSEKGGGRRKSWCRDR